MIRTVLGRWSRVVSQPETPTTIFPASSARTLRSQRLEAFLEDLSDRSRPATKDERPTTVLHYFFAGATGCVCAGIPCNTDFERLARRDAYTDSVMDVTIKMTADQVVALDNAVAAPRGPNAVWLPMPPKAAVMSPLLPLCSSTIMIRNKQTIM